VSNFFGWFSRSWVYLSCPFLIAVLPLLPGAPPCVFLSFNSRIFRFGLSDVLGASSAPRCWGLIFGFLKQRVVFLSLAPRPIVCFADPYPASPFSRIYLFRKEPPMPPSLLMLSFGVFVFVWLSVLKTPPSRPAFLCSASHQSP